MPVKIIKKNNLLAVNIFNKASVYLHKVINLTKQYQHKIMLSKQNHTVNTKVINTQLQDKLRHIFTNARFVNSEQKMIKVEGLAKTVYSNLQGLREYLQVLKYLRLHTEYSYSEFTNAIQLSMTRRVQFIHVIYEQHLITCPAFIAPINHHLVGLTEMYLLHNLDLNNQTDSIKNQQALKNTIAFNCEHLR